MSTYGQIFYQLVFATKNRQPTINPTHENDLYKYIFGIVKSKKCKLYRINGMSDHIHIFCDLHLSLSLSNYIKDIKISSNLWMKESKNFPDFESWQEGYGAFTYSIKEKDNMIEYIKNQKEHHKTENFYDEFKRIIIKNGIEFDEKYFYNYGIQPLQGWGIIHISTPDFIRGYSC